MKKSLFSSLCLIFIFGTPKSFAQTPLQENQLMTVQYCKVKPSNSDAYRVAVKEFISALTEAKIESAEWYAHWQDSYTYLYAVPIDNMAEFDDMYWKEAVEKIGKEKFQALSDKMGSLIDVRTNVVYQLVNELSYQHQDYKERPTRYLEWTMIQIDPTKKDELTRLAQQRVKLYEENDIVGHFGYYESVLGHPDGSIAVVSFAESPLQMAEETKMKLDKVGSKEQAIWNEVKAIMTSLDQITGYYLPDLSYLQPQEKQ